MARYKKKPVIINATQYDGNFRSLDCFSINEVKNFILRGGDLYIPTLEGEMHVSKNNYVIRGISGEYYPCKPDIFERTYDIVID